MNKADTKAGKKKKGGPSPFKKAVGKVHLWLGLASGLIVCFLGITGCMLAFEREIENATQSFRFVQEQPKALLPPSTLEAIARQQLRGKKLHSLSYEPGHSAIASFYNGDPEYYYLVFIDPYTGKVLHTRDMSRDFFRVVINGHFYLWLPPKIGQPIVASATLIFVVLLITGIILWWPRNKAARKQRFTVKLNAKWRRTNYDLHNVLGFYMSWIIIFIAFTGLVWGFEWFAKTVFWTTSGGKAMTEFSAPLSDTTAMTPGEGRPAADILWQRMRQENPGYRGVMEVHIPEGPNAALEIALNPDGGTYWKADYRFFDQYTLKEMDVRHTYGKLKQTTMAEKIQRMNYDIHVGAVAGIAGKIMAFLASLICASMPVTGFLIWWGRKYKSKKEKAGTAKPAARKAAVV
ncbi:PepSY-associated TM helix domain-containing protein [Taibaiella helva]|uniref:PepSY-associated TM helix domain-containing protein n=1 Tax=Taibaiella helva TaxID=2301235 RepID=UPI000E56CF34|nr:PepSY-associated TM helix domain-containing protein [Taibaiella helva]